MTTKNRRSEFIETYTVRRTPLKRKTPIKPKFPKDWGKLTTETGKTKKHPLKRATSPKVKSKPSTAVKLRSKAKTQAKLKKDLDTIFSKYIRAKYPKRCYTCGKTGIRLQCGHYISRQYLVTRWDENNCRPQCWGCNGYGKGQPLIFEENLKRELGNDFIEKMKASRHKILKLDCNWYEEKIREYEDILKNYE